MPADGAYVLSPADVSKIRSYVQHKYAAMPQSQRAEIVADAVKRIIYKQLPEFDQALKRQVTEMLIRTTVLEQQRPVRMDDILEACLSLDRSMPAVRESLCDWINSGVGASYNRDVLVALLDELSAMEAVSGDRWRILVQKLEHAQPAAAKIVLGAAAPAEVIALPVPFSAPIARRRRMRSFMYAALSVFVLTASLMYGMSLLQKPSAIAQLPRAAEPEAAATIYEPIAGLPIELRYTEIDSELLVAYLHTKSSMLADQPYFGAIVSAAKEFDIHPVLLFAITGQEQGFVPRTHNQAEEIANNPFNVFHSWQDFNTDIYESAQIAARTVTNISKDRPPDADAIVWINATYAEDPNWSKGVRTIFNTIIRYLEENAVN